MKYIKKFEDKIYNPSNDEIIDVINKSLKFDIRDLIDRFSDIEDNSQYLIMVFKFEFLPTEDVKPKYRRKDNTHDLIFFNNTHHKNGHSIDSGVIEIYPDTYMLKNDIMFNNYTWKYFTKHIFKLNNIIIKIPKGSDFSKEKTKYLFDQINSISKIYNLNVGIVSGYNGENNFILR